MTNTAKIIVLAVIIAILGGGYFFMKNKSVSDVPSVVPEQEDILDSSAATPESQPLPKPSVGDTKPVLPPKLIFPNAVQSPDPSSVSKGPVIIAVNLPKGRVGESYNVFVTASGGGKAYTWKIIAGTIPPGLTGVQSLDCSVIKNQECHSSFQISGTPAKEGAYSIRVGVSDGVIAVYKDFSINVERALNLKITTASLPQASLGANYEAEINGTGGTGVYLWSTFGSLPPDLSLVPIPCQEASCMSRAKITGVARGLGTRTFTVILSSGNETVSKEYTIIVK